MIVYSGKVDGMDRLGRDANTMRRDMVLMYLGVNPPCGEGQEVRSWDPRPRNGRGLGVRRLTNILCRPIGKGECSLCHELLTPVYTPGVGFSHTQHTCW